MVVGMVVRVGEVAAVAVFDGDGRELRHACCGGVGGAAVSGLVAWTGDVC